MKKGEAGECPGFLVNAVLSKMVHQGGGRLKKSKNAKPDYQKIHPTHQVDNQKSSPPLSNCRIKF